MGDCYDLDDERYTLNALEEECQFSDAIIIRVSSEYELVLEMNKLLDIYNPEILTGYNIKGFDVGYMNTRLVDKMLAWPNMSCLKNYESKAVFKRCNSKPYGTMFNFYIDMPGRISVDLLDEIKRNHKFASNKLDFVASELVGASKHDVTPKYMFQTYAAMIETLDNKHETMFAMTRVISYCIQDSELVLDIIEKINLIIGLQQTSNVGGITIEDVNSRGQQFGTFSSLYDFAHPKGYVLDKYYYEKINVKGAFVNEPSPGRWENVICEDFASLYPNIIRELNACYTTFIRPEDDHLVPDEMCNVRFIHNDDEEINLTEFQRDESGNILYNNKYSIIGIQTNNKYHT